MKTIHCLLLLTLGLVFTATQLHAQRASKIRRRALEDPEFVKSFIGSYAFLIGYEPKSRIRKRMSFDPWLI